MAITDKVNLYHSPAFAGQVADIELCNTVSRTNTDKDVIAYGLGVVRDGENGFKLPTTTSNATDFVGVPVRSLQDITPAGKAFGTNPQFVASVLTVGAIWVTVSEKVAAGEPACLAIASGSAGKFCKTAGDSTAVAIPGAVFRTGAEANGLALVAFNIGG